MSNLPIVQYDKTLPEIPGRLPWERPAYHLVKTSAAKDGWAIAPDRRQSKLLLIETLIFVVEVLGHRDCKETIRNFGSVYGEDLFRTAGINFQTLPDGTRQVSRFVAEVDREQVQDLPVENLRRHAFKMATGSGKTWVMALCIVWSYYRHQEGKSGGAADLGLSSNFLIVSPNVIVHQRLERDFEGNRIFHELPLVPPEWGKLNFKVIKRGDFAEPDAGGNLFISNIHQLYEGRDQPWTPSTAIEALLGAPVKKDSLKKGRPMLERVKSLRDVIVLNDEAHHVHDSELEWHRSLMAVHNALPGGLSLWLDYSATPQQGELFYPWVIVDYPLAQAVEDRIVKAPLIVRHVSGTKLPPQDPTGITKENVCDKYGYWIHAAVERWKVHTKAYKATGLKPVLFIMAEKTGYADLIGKHLVDAHGFKEKEVLVIHTDTTGEITKADLDKARIAANEIDKPDNKIRAIVSVMILKEGWDVRNVSVVLGLRPFGTAILPQQVIGRGLRLMDRTLLGPDRTQTLEVLGTKNLLDTLKANLEAEGVGVGDTGDPPPMPVTITPLKERATHDIAIPLTKPSLFHNVQKLSGLDVMAMESILTEQGLEEVFKIKLQADFATVEVFVGAPEIHLQAQPLHETLAYLTNRICDMAKLGGKFAELYPLVASYVEHRCFGRMVEINPDTDEGTKVSEHLTRQDIRESVARRLAHNIAKLLVERRELIFANQDFTLGETRPFTWRRNLSAGPLVCKKTVFNYVATYNDFERRFAQFLDKKGSGILRFAALGTTEQGDSNTSFRVDYLKPTGAIGFYYPDWVAVEETEAGETSWIIETKGRIFDKEQVKAKDAAIKDWCRRISESTGERWDYLHVDQKTFDRATFASFSDLTAFARADLLSSQRD
jgi:type III restriction enzyme